MMMSKVVSRDIVKPSAYNHKTFHKFSFFDQMAPSIYVPLLFFYTSTKNCETDNQRYLSCVLKVSLSVALSRYYPLAGRIKDDVTVDCNDEGALFLEARMECNVSQILKNPDDEILKLLFPDSLCFNVSIRTGPVAVQVTYFQNGGMSIGICLCHKVLDMASMCSFIKNWASIARIMQQEKPELATEISIGNPSLDSIRDGISRVCPEFNIGSLYPPRDLSARKKVLPPLEVKKSPSRRLGFDTEKIAKLKEMVSSQVPNPTRVEVVTSLLYKSAISAATKASSSGSSKPTVLQQAMNLRTRIFNPPVPEGSTGNLVGYYPVSISESKEVDLGWIVKEFRQMKTQFTSSYAKASNPDEMFSLVVESSKALTAYIDGEEGYFCSSWCRFGFYEGADFGWGKPFLVTSICWDMKNIIVVMDNEEGSDGIQAFITLDENVMDMFELDEQLEFSCINPSLF